MLGWLPSLLVFGCEACEPPLPQVARLPRSSSHPWPRTLPELIPRFSGDTFLVLFGLKLPGIHHDALPDDQLSPSFDSSARFPPAQKHRRAAGVWKATK